MDKYTATNGATFRSIRDPYCVFCHYPQDPTLGYRRCRTCNTLITHENIPLNYEMARSSTLYLSDQPNSETKFILRGKSSVPTCGVLAEAIENRIRKEFPGMLLSQAVVPVPMSASKLASRGFNHAEAIAKDLARRLEFPIADLLQVVREPPQSQHNLRLSQRLHNVEGCYAVKLPSSGSLPRVVLLVDNLYTTGATAIECSKVLRNAGVLRVMVATAGRAVMKSDLGYLGAYVDA